MILILMGVTGSGKSSVGRALASRLGVPFVEGDALHPDSNRLKMSAGQPLDDTDRWPWLDAIARTLVSHEKAGTGAVASCSALKRAYRERLLGACPQARFLLLHGPRALLSRRLGARRGHFMPASLLDSQLRTLEMPGQDEEVVILDIAQPVAALVEQVTASVSAADLGGSPPPAPGARRGNVS